MARSREFDRDAVLEQAMNVFWRHGYAAASTADLLAAMGIGRQSMYDTFGDKRALYLEALARYCGASVADQLRVAQLARQGNAGPLDAISAMLQAFAARPEAQNGLGCMGINSICEFGAADEQVNAAREAGGVPLRAGLELLLREAVAAGETSAGADIGHAVAYIGATLAGIRVSAKAGADMATLRAIADFAVAALRAPVPAPSAKRVLTPGT